MIWACLRIFANAFITISVCVAYWSVAGPVVIAGLVAIWGFALTQILWFYTHRVLHKFVYMPCRRFFYKELHLNGRA